MTNIRPCQYLSIITISVLNGFYLARLIYFDLPNTLTCHSPVSVYWHRHEKHAVLEVIVSLSRRLKVSTSTCTRKWKRVLFKGLSLCVFGCMCQNCAISSCHADVKHRAVTSFHTTSHRCLVKIKTLFLCSGNCSIFVYLFIYCLPVRPYVWPKTSILLIWTEIVIV